MKKIRISILFLLCTHYLKNWFDKVNSVIQHDIAADPGFTKTDTKFNEIASVLRIK